MLEVTNVSKKFGKVRALEKVSFFFKPKTIYAVVGLNCSGKTTLLDILSGFQKADEGRIIFNKKRIENLQPWEISKLGIARTFQIPRTFKNMSVLENLEIAKNRKSSLSSLDVLELLGIKEEKDKPAGTLSYARQKLVEMGKALMLEPELILLDEPFSGVSEVMKRRIMEIIKELAKGKSFVIAEQNLEDALEISELVYVLSSGRKIAEGTADEIKVNPKVAESYDF